MKSRAASSIALSLAVLAGAAPASATITVPYAPQGATTLADGVRHEWGTLVTAKTQYVNVVEVDQARPGVGVRLSQADGIATHRRTVVDQALAYDRDERDVVASVNGSTYFYMYAPDGQPGATGQGLNISDGELINAGAPASSAAILAFGLDATGGARIGDPGLEMALTLPGATQVTVDRVNQKRLTSDVVLYTPRFDSHTWTDAIGSEYVVEGFALPLTTTGSYSGTVVEVRAGQGDTPIGAGQVVVSVADGSPAAAALAGLQVGDAVSLTTRIGEDWQGVVNSVGGRDLLVDDGLNVATGTARNARIGVGIRADGSLLLLAADNGDLDGGGIALPDLAELMRDLGAVDAVNLDGGNSSQMAVHRPGAATLDYVNGHLESVDKYLPVSNALQVVSDAPFEGDAPVVEAPRISLSPVAKVAARAASIDVAWSASDDSVVSEVEAELRIGSGAWLTVASESASTAAVRVQVPYGRAFSVRVRATDSWGNTSAWVVSRRLRASVINESDAAVIRSGGWRLLSESHSFGGACRRSRTTAARAELSFDGYQVGLVALVGPRGGSAQIRMDGNAVASIDTYAATADQRRLLFLGPAAETAAPHLIEVRNAGTDARPLVEIDAFLVLEDAS